MVEETAEKYDINPGLLATVAITETPSGTTEPYLRGGAVSSFDIGVDDFYDKQSSIRKSVPAASEIPTFTSAMTHEDLNEKGRPVRSVTFRSGAEALSAVAAYLKHGENAIRERAGTAGKDFDALSTDTQFALTRIAYHGGIGKASSVLAQALTGKDILIRHEAQWGPQRAATVRTAQAEHLSQKVFGVPP
jgi:hypothetical protein